MRPDTFIKIAEETGLIVPLGELILIEACEQSNRWSNEGLPPFSVSVNVSARQFEQKDFVSSLSQVFDERSLDTNRLVFELTEYVVMSDASHTIKTLNELKSMGIHLAIDDFGTGYSSLSYLNQFPIDTLKIDQSFIQNLGRSQKDYVLIEAIVAMAHSLGLEITAEGVKALQQYRATKDLGCDRVQGFYLDRPMSADSITNLFTGGKKSFISG